MEVTENHQPTATNGQFAWAWMNMKEVWLENEKTGERLGPFRTLCQSARAIGRDDSYIHQQIKRKKTKTKDGWTWIIKDKDGPKCPHCGKEIK